MIAPTRKIAKAVVTPYAKRLSSQTAAPTGTAPIINTWLMRRTILEPRTACAPLGRKCRDARRRRHRLWIPTPLQPGPDGSTRRRPLAVLRMTHYLTVHSASSISTRSGIGAIDMYARPPALWTIHGPHATHAAPIFAFPCTNETKGVWPLTCVDANRHVLGVKGSWVQIPPSRQREDFRTSATAWRIKSIDGYRVICPVDSFTLAVRGLGPTTLSINVCPDQRSVNLVSAGARRSRTP